MAKIGRKGNSYQRENAGLIFAKMHFYLFLYSLSSNHSKRQNDIKLRIEAEKRFFSKT
jgi:hypothetical protein